MFALNGSHIRASPDTSWYGLRFRPLRSYPDVREQNLKHIFSYSTDALCIEPAAYGAAHKTF